MLALSDVICYTIPSEWEKYNEKYNEKQNDNDRDSPTLQPPQSPRGEKAEALKKRRKEMFEAAEAVGNVVDGEIWDFGCEC